MSLSELRTTLEKTKGKQEQVLLDKAALEKIMELEKRNLKRHERAREIIKHVGKKTQEQLSFHISDITSLALSAVFPNPYELHVNFVERRNKMECDLMFFRDGHEMEPKDASGGGAIDVAAFALRIASWSMQNPKSRNVVLLDEPMRFLSVDLQNQASEMIKQVSEKLCIQLIIITHESTLAAFADKVFEAKLKKGITYIT